MCSQRPGKSSAAWIRCRKGRILHGGHWRRADRRGSRRRQPAAAFYNVCRHHAAAVVTEAQGCAKQFRCPYHGWTYGIDGALKGMLEFEGVCNFDRAKNGLVPVRVDTWENFVFVNLDGKAMLLKDFLGAIPGIVAPLQLTKKMKYSTAASTR